MWLFGLTMLGLLAVSAFGFAVLRNMKTRSIWLEATDGQQVSISGGTQNRYSAEMKVGIESGAIPRQSEVSRHSLWEDNSYFWVVLCKNDSFHRHSNLNHVHRIPLGETDAAIPRPPVFEPFAVRCNECGKDYLYEPLEVLRYEMEVPSSFVPHKLFRE